MSIIFTGFVTFIFTVLAGIALNYFRNIQPTIIYQSTEAIPLEIGDKKIGAYLVELANVSSRTIEDITLNVQAGNVKLKNGGTKYSQGLKFTENIKNDMFEIYIPFLKKKRVISYGNR